MPPEPAILKRQRSRPSDWWASNPTLNVTAAPPQQDEPPLRKRGRPSISGAERGIQEAPAAGNRGKRRTSINLDDTENAEDGDGELSKPLRRGRSSNTDAELVAAAAELATEAESANMKKRERPAQRVEKVDGTITKPVIQGRLSNTEAELNAATEVATENDGVPQEKRGRSVQRREEVVRTAAKPFRRGRSSNTEAELRAAREKAAHMDAVPNKKRGRSVVVDAEEDELGNELVEAATEPKKRGRPAVSRERDERVDDVVEGPPAPKKRGRPAATHAEETYDRELPTGGLEDGTKRRGRTSMSKAEEQTPESPENDEIAEAVKPLRHEPSSNIQDELQAAAKRVTNPQAASKKRGRRPKVADQVDAAIRDPSAEGNEAAKPPRRGRSSNTEAEVRASVEMSATERNTQRKCGKAANAKAKPSAVVAEHAKAVRNKKRTRQSDTDTVGLVTTTSTQDKDGPKKRTQHSDGAIGEPAASGSVAKDEAGRTARGQQSGTVIEVEAATSSLARDRNLRKKGDNSLKATNVIAKKGSVAAQEFSKSKRRSHPGTADIRESNESQPSGKKSKHLTNADAKRKRKEVEEPNEEPPESKRRRVEREPQQELVPQAEKPPMYQHLAAVTRRVARQTIEAKWGPLPPSCIELISQLLQHLQRPVVVPLNDERKRREAIKVMQMVSRRLISKILKGLPFPPGIRSRREDDFDFEKILDHNRALESQLTPALHANELLESELAKGKAFLESEEVALAELETNAKTEAAVRKNAARRVHSLLLLNDSKVEKDGMNDHIDLAEDYSILPFSHAEDEDGGLQDIARDLNGHLDTVQGNISRVKGISQAMTQSRAAVQATLFDRLEMNQFEDVVLG